MNPNKVFAPHMIFYREKENHEKSNYLFECPQILEILEDVRNILVWSDAPFLSALRQSVKGLDKSHGVPVNECDTNPIEQQKPGNIKHYEEEWSAK